MRPRWLIQIALAVVIHGVSLSVSAEDLIQSRLHGYVGGPYKVLARDVTGDGHPDLLLGFRQLGLIAVEVGDGRGNFAPPVLSELGRHLGVPDSDKTRSEPHVHNLARLTWMETGCPRSWRRLEA